MFVTVFSVARALFLAPFLPLAQLRVWASQIGLGNVVFVNLGLVAIKLRNAPAKGDLILPFWGPVLGIVTKLTLLATPLI